MKSMDFVRAASLSFLAAFIAFLLAGIIFDIYIQFQDPNPEGKGGSGDYICAFPTPNSILPGSVYLDRCGLDAFRKNLFNFEDELGILLTVLLLSSFSLLAALPLLLFGIVFCLWTWMLLRVFQKLKKSAGTFPKGVPEIFMVMISTLIFIPFWTFLVWPYPLNPLEFFLQFI